MRLDLYSVVRQFSFMNMILSQTSSDQELEQRGQQRSSLAPPLDFLYWKNLLNFIVFYEYLKSVDRNCLYLFNIEFISMKNLKYIVLLVFVLYVSVLEAKKSNPFIINEKILRFSCRQKEARSSRKTKKYWCSFILRVLQSSH